MVPDDKLEEIDRWAMMRLDRLTAQVNAAYESYEFHDAFHKIHNFCVVDLSNFYLDVLKDRLYVEKADSLTRRAAQTVIYRLLGALTRLLAPILAFTAEEIWSFMPHGSGDDAESVLFNEIPKPGFFDVDNDFLAKWERINALCSDVKKALETARTDKVIGSSLDASVTLHCKGETLDFVRSVSKILPAVLIVSQLVVAEDEGGDFKGDFEGLGVTVAHADGEKCARCWTYSDTVGNSSHGDLCDRCAAIVG